MATFAPTICSRSTIWRRAVPAIATVVVAVGGLFLLVRGVAGVSWSEIVALLDAASRSRLVLLGLVWLGGLVVYTRVLSAALPGLGLRRSLLLNLSGSAVANLLPLGGALATGLNWRMVRGWGHSNAAFNEFCVLTNVLDVLSKLLLPSAAALALFVTAQTVPSLIWALAVACLVSGGLMATGAVLLGHCGRRAGVVSRVVRHLGGLLRDAFATFRARPLSLTAGSVGYLVAQLVLLQLCLGAVGVAAPWSVVLTTLALERLASLVPVSPGGVGVAELGAVAWLLAAGVDPTGAVSGLLLYRLFIVGMEIPVGAVLLAGWVWGRRGSR